MSLPQKLEIKSLESHENHQDLAPDCLAVPHLPVPCYYDGLRRLAVLRFYVFDGGHGSLLRPCRVLLAVQDHLSGF